MKNVRRKTLIAMACAVAFVAVGATPAQAADFSVAAEFNCTGSLVQYGTYRAHTSGAGAKIKIDHMWWTDSQEGRWGLRNTSNSQVTNSVSFTGSGTPGTKTFTNTGGGLGIAGSSLAINARLVGTNNCVPVPTWDGVLTQ